jgi:Ca-activated chloride channel family protein
MSWMTPWAAFWLLAALVPILLLLYVLRLRRSRQLIPSTSLWQEAAEDIQANTPFQRLRRNLLLLLQLIALLMLACAIAQPRFESAMGRGERTIVLIDRSASMQATDGGGGRTRFEAARDVALAAIDRLHPGGWFADSGGQTMIVSLGDTAEIVQPFTSSRRALQSAIDRIKVGDTAARLKPGLLLARIWSSEPNPDAPRGVGGPARLELLSDGGLVDLGEVSLQDDLLLFHQVGEGGLENQSVQLVVSERMPDDPAQVQVFASLWNWDQESADVRVQMSVDSTAVHIEDVTIPAATRTDGDPVEAGRRNIVFSPVTRAEETLVEVRIVGEDVLPVDDVAWDVVPAPDDMSVLLVTTDRVLLKRAISVLPGISLRTAEPDVLAQGVPSGIDLVVLDQVELDVLPDVATLSLDCRLPSNHLRWSDRRGPELMLVSDARHPILRGGPPRDLWVQSAQGVWADGQVRPLLTGTQGLLALAWEEGGHRRVHVAFDPAESTWPWDPTFMTFLMDATDWLGRRGLGGDAVATEAGGMLSLSVPADVSTVFVTSPSGDRQSWSPQSGGRVSWGPARESGPWLVEWNGANAGRRLVAVRLPAATEGDLQQRGDLTIGDERFASSGSGGRPVPLWPWAILGALVVLLIEWAVYCRRIR